MHEGNTAQSITGLRYNAFQFGPVPYNYDILFVTLFEIDAINIEYDTMLNSEVERILPYPKYQFDASLFSSTELEIMENIVNKFKETSASDIAEISHQLPAWRENIEGKRIIPFS